MPHTRTQTTSRNLLLQMHICAAELATWGVCPDVNTGKEMTKKGIEAAISVPMLH